MRTHFCVNIEAEMLRIKNSGKTALDCSPQQAFSELVQAKREGKTFYAGCDSMTQEGRCGGHVD